MTQRAVSPDYSGANHIAAFCLSRGYRPQRVRCRQAALNYYNVPYGTSRRLTIAEQKEMEY
jgi:hypothetical protein